MRFFYTCKWFSNESHISTSNIYRHDRACYPYTYYPNVIFNFRSLCVAATDQKGWFFSGQKTSFEDAFNDDMKENYNCLPTQHMSQVPNLGSLLCGSPDC